MILFRIIICFFLLNSISADEVLSDEKKSAQWDWSDNLVGKVHKEVQIPITNKEDGNYCKDIMRSMCVAYLRDMIIKSRGYVDNDIILHQTDPFPL